MRIGTRKRLSIFSTRKFWKTFSGTGAFTNLKDKTRYQFNVVIVNIKIILTVCVSGQTQLHYRQERLAAELIFNLNNPRTTVLYAKKIGWRWQTTTSHIPFFEEWIRTNGLVVKASSSESGDLGSIPDEC